jgi:hypothetical protein
MKDITPNYRCNLNKDTPLAVKTRNIIQAISIHVVLLYTIMKSLPDFFKDEILL